VEVELILPGIPDKQIPYALAKTHYAALLAAGVKIWEYTPGFVHAKVMIADGQEAAVGTINLDYRSLYHHFECAVWMRGTPCIAAMERDFLRTRALCRAVTPRSLHGEPLWRKLVGFVMKAVAPLL
jgi:cardiolipin synthase